MGNDSIWKKEITLGRKKKPAQPAAEAAATPAPAAQPEHVPFWKKEIAVGGRKPKAPQTEAAASPEEAKPEPVPFWKREISVGGRKPTPPKPRADAPEPVPFWKREIPVGGTTRDTPAARDEVPFWKREVTLGRKQKEIDRLAEEATQAFAAPEPELHEPIKAAEAAAAALIADPNAEIEIFFQAPRARPVEREPVEPEPVEPELPAAPAPAAAAGRPAPPAPPAPAPAAPSLPAPVAEVTPPAFEPLPEPPPLELPAQPAPAASTLPPAPPPPPAPPRPAPAYKAPPLPQPQGQPLPPPLPTPAPAAPPVPPRAAAPAPAPAPVPVPAPAPAPAAPVVQPPVPAAELPPLRGADEPKVPWWKKEISFSSKPKPQTVPAAVRTAPPPAAPAAAPVPFWRKKIEIGRTAKPGEEVSIWKKEISFSRKSKPAAAEAVGAAPTAAATTAASATAAEPKVPWWKKEIGPGKKKQPASATATAAPAAPKPAAAKSNVPFWKRELSLSSLKGASVSKPAAKSSRSRKKPPPKAKRLVGLKVGASQIAAARVVNNGVAELLQVARQPLDHGIVVSGELRDPDALAAQLKAFFVRNKLPRRNVRLGIASNRIGVRIFDVAGIHDEAQLENAIQFRAQEALPIPLDEAVLDYHVLSEGVDAEGQPTRRILLVVAYRELVDRYVAACRKAGITLMGIDLEAFALLRALAAPREEAEPAKAALVGVAIGHDRSTFAVSDGRVCEFTRVLEWGGAALNVAMARALDLAPSEVESYKRALVLDGPAPVPEGLTQEQWGTALDAVRRQLQSFARELVSSLQFYQNQPGSLGIGEIVLTGGTAHMPGLAEELQRLIGVQVRVGDPLARVKVAKKVATAEQIGSLAVAIGLGIED